MDESERKQLVIGLVTHTYYTLRHHRDADDPEFVAGLSTLTEGLGASNLRRSVELPQTPEALQALIDDCVKDAIGQASMRTLRSSAR